MKQRRPSIGYLIGSLLVHFFLMFLLIFAPEPHSQNLDLTNILEPAAPPQQPQVTFLSLGNYHQPAVAAQPQQSTPQPPAPQQQAMPQPPQAAAEPPPTPTIKEAKSEPAPEMITTEARMPEFGKKASTKPVEKNKKFRRHVTPEELKQLARLAVVKDKVIEHQKTQTRNDFFRHAAFIASQPAVAASQGPEGRISGMGDLKEHSYKMKLRDALLNAYNSVRYQIRQQASYADAGTASLHCVINKDGSIAELAIMMSSGDPNFDRLILESITKAAPFPAIPDHLGVEKFILGGMTIS
jgi:TonB family protein